MKKILLLFLFLFLLENCGYSPMYSKNQKVDFYIQSLQFDNGDKDLASFIKSNLNNYFNKNTGTNFVIEAKIKYQKISVSKTIEAVTEEYNLSSDVSFRIKSENVDKIINISEKFKMNNLTDEFDEREYEKIIKRNMARSITSKLLIQLTRLNVN